VSFDSTTPFQGEPPSRQSGIGWSWNPVFICWIPSTMFVNYGGGFGDATRK
jgi:hypothetical protein